MSNAPIDVVMAMDDGYVAPATVMMSSLARVADTDVRLHVIDGGLGAGRGEELASTLKPFVDVTIYAAPDPLELNLSPGAYNDYLSSASMTRLQMAELLPADVRRVLYLDADLLVLEDPQQIWTADLGGNCAGAVRDRGWPNRRTVIHDDGEVEEYYEGAAAPGYFNSGVMVVDLERWREQEVLQKCRRLHDAAGSTLRAPDQDMLNMVLESAWTPLPDRWNVLILKLADPDVHIGADEKWANFLASQEPGPGRDAWAEHLARREGIVHYSGRRKPWQDEFPDGPLKEVWAEHTRAAEEMIGSPIDFDR